MIFFFLLFLHLCGRAPHARRCKLKVPSFNCRRGGESSTLIAAAKQAHRRARPYYRQCSARSRKAIAQGHPAALSALSMTSSSLNWPSCLQYCHCLSSNLLVYAIGPAAMAAKCNFSPILVHFFARASCSESAVAETLYQFRREAKFVTFSPTYSEASG